VSSRSEGLYFLGCEAGDKPATSSCKLDSLSSGQSEVRQKTVDPVVFSRVSYPFTLGPHGEALSIAQPKLRRVHRPANGFAALILIRHHDFLRIVGGSDDLSLRRRIYATAVVILSALQIKWVFSRPCK
jgi:hypothetical protein